MSELKQFGKALRKLINSPKVFSLLRDGDWGAGGCWQLASALADFVSAGPHKGYYSRTCHRCLAVQKRGTPEDRRS